MAGYRLQETTLDCQIELQTPSIVASDDAAFSIGSELETAPQENNMTETILITGTSSGLGRATAQLFHAKGWNVVATMRSPEKERELTELDRTMVTHLDVQDPGSIQSAVEAALAKFGRIDVLVNNAGYGAYGPLEATPLEKIRRQFDVNVLGLLATTRAVLPHFRANASGTIVNVSSIGGRIAYPLGALYHGTKFAVEGLSESLSYELGELGIRVKIIEPGMIKTDFGGRSFDFSNDTKLTAYQPLVQTLTSTFGLLMESASSSGAIAEVIYTAATDGSSQLRYEAGADAAPALASRRALNDAQFISGMKARFGLVDGRFKHRAASHDAEDVKRPLRAKGIEQ
jgi:NAD(P)-dependent dehydrogenase (short-subunit alcohol dehydrogenase family)